eukprot:scaffold258241_cov52-Attheya_sp.AAC.1
MTDVVVGAADVVKDAVVAKLARDFKDHYNEDNLKEMILSELHQIKDDTKALRNVEFKTARDTLTTWCNSRGCMGSSTDLDPLKTAAECSRKAFNAVPDPLDKMMAVTYLVYAEYHRVALSYPTAEDGPNWTKGKKYAQKLLMQYFDPEMMPQLFIAANEELGSSFNRYNRMFRNKDKRRKMLR